MGKIFVISFFIVSTFAFGQVGSSDPCLKQNLPTFKNGKYNLEKVTTIGNDLWAPLGVSGKAGQWYKSILYLVNDFEKVNPDIEVTIWHLQENIFDCDGCTDTHPIIEGVWIDHKPKQKSK